MDQHPFSLNIIITDIRAFCTQCMGKQRNAVCENNACVLYKHKYAICQIDLLDGNYKQLWIENAVKIALAMPDMFWWGDYHQAVKASMREGHKNWFGGLAGILKNKYGFQILSTTRKSLRKAANGTEEHLWKKAV